LIVDDEISVGQMLGRMLEPQFDVTICSEGQKALDILLQDQAYHGVLCDIMMPNMSGVQLYEEVLRQAPGSEQRFVFMTGGALLPNVAEFLSRVERPKIEKPFDLTELRQVLRGL
jgi:CheY-like chemotaxis protein